MAPETLFSNLCEGQKCYRARLLAAGSALAEIGGGAGEVAPIARALCGWDNNTTRQIAKVFQQLSFPPQPTAEQRLIQIAVLGPVAHLGRRKLCEYGIDVGKDLVASALAWVRDAGKAPKDGRVGNSNAGRCVAGAPGGIREEWLQSSYCSSKGEGRRVLYGTLDSHAKRIASSQGVSASTAKLRKPDEVVLAKRATDLCDVCGAALRACSSVRTVSTDCSLTEQRTQPL